MAGKRRRYRVDVDPVVAHERSVIGGRARTTPDYFIRKLTEAAASLTGEQKRRLAELVMPFLADPADPADPGGGRDAA